MKMEINITSKGLDILPEHLEKEVTEKLNKLKRYFNNVQKASVALTKQRGQYTAETTLYVAGRLIRAVGKGSLLDSALNKNLSKLKTQVQKYNEHFKSPRYKTKTIEANLVEETPKIVKVKTFTIKPMSVEEAILQLELLDHDFFIFKEEATDEYNVIYKRKDGNYGLIKPQG
jgi:putative sigma-54 modulation protein